jgi:predicted nucleic acid-binding protein
MKVFFDTNVYIAEALLGGAAEQMVTATVDARWRIITNGYVLDETFRAMTEKLGFLSMTEYFTLLVNEGHISS